MAMIVATMLSGCKPNLSTERGRYHYLEGHIYDTLAAKLNCTTARVSFVATEERNGKRYDTYRVNGCGRSSDLITNVREDAGFIIWAISVPPPEDAYVHAAEQQVQTVARFDLSCDDVEVVPLNAVIDTMRTGYRATLGARGCERQVSYDVICADNGFVDGVREVVCTRTTGSGPAQPAGSQPR